MRFEQHSPYLQYKVSLPHDDFYSKRIVANSFQVYKALGIGWATSLLGFASLVMLPIPWIFFKWGPKIRSKSSYVTVQA